MAVCASSGGQTSPSIHSRSLLMASARIAPQVVLRLRSRPGERLDAVLRRAGLAEAPVIRAVEAIAEAVDVANGGAFDVIVRLEGMGSERRLLSLRLTGGAAPVSLIRSGDGFAVRVDQTEPTPAPRARSTPAPVRPSVVEGPMEAVLYAENAGLSRPMADQAMRLFARDLDFARDVHLGDPVRLIVRDATLLYAELSGRDADIRFYRYQPANGAPLYLNAEGRSAESILLRTPVADARVTSGFGPRRHPILGYTRLHQGVDFAAPSGAPVVAAAGGRVLEVGWRGGYGRLVRLDHGHGVETLYGHLSRWPAGLGVGDLVRQGAVVGYVGASGLATGPHLHYEVTRAGQRVDPRSATGPAPPGLTGPALLAFEAHRREIDALLVVAL